MAVALTLLTAAFCEDGEAIGVNWTSAEAAVPAARMTALAQKALSPGKWPLELWFGFHVFAGDEDAGQATRGMVSSGLQAFVGRKVEVEPSLVAPQTMAERMFGTLLYLLAEGPVLKDNDTLGVSQTERIHIHLRDQGWRPGIPIYALRFEDVE